MILQRINVLGKRTCLNQMQYGCHWATGYAMHIEDSVNGVPEVVQHRTRCHKNHLLAEIFSTVEVVKQLEGIL